MGCLQKAECGRPGHSNVLNGKSHLYLVFGHYGGRCAQDGRTPVAP
jgi:hypothetical protein